MDTLLWIGFVVAVILVIAVAAGLIYALRRFHAERGSEPRQVSGSPGLQVRLGGGLGVLALVLLVVGIVFTEQARETPATAADGLDIAEAPGSDPETDPRFLEIDATGQQWLWRYDYPNEAFTYYKLVVPVDTTVKLDLVSTDVVHTWDVPALAPKADAVPGKNHVIYFRADEEGTYRGQSATLSGQGYAPMRTAVEVVSPDEYATFVEEEKDEIQEAQDRVVELIENGEAP